MTDRTLIDRPAVAARLGHSVEWLYKHMPDMLAAGFPMPVIGNQRSARWDPRAIDRWLDARMPPQISGPSTLPQIVMPADLARESAELDRRSEELAAGRRRRG